MCYWDCLCGLGRSWTGLFLTESKLVGVIGSIFGAWYSITINVLLLDSDDQTAVFTTVMEDDG